MQKITVLDVLSPFEGCRKSHFRFHRSLLVMPQDATKEDDETRKKGRPAVKD